MAESFLFGLNGTCIVHANKDLSHFDLIVTLIPFSRYFTSIRLYGEKGGNFLINKKNIKKKALVLL